MCVRERKKREREWEGERKRKREVKRFVSNERRNEFIKIS